MPTTAPPPTTEPPPTTGTTDDSAEGPQTTDESMPPETSETTDGTTGEELPDGPFVDCFKDEFVNQFPGPNYDDFGINVGSHCMGTDHQDIENIERVVFLGDSVTVGTPPSPVADYYRSRLADMLADRFGLSFDSNKGLWQLPNPIDGTSVNLHSGDFSSCAKWGARNDDLVNGNQVEDCYTEEQRQLNTLTIFTSGGNDLSRIASDASEGATFNELLDTANSAIQHLEDTFAFFTDEKNFPNGSTVVFGNIYEFTDATGEVESCDLSGLAGFSAIPPDANALLIVAHLESEYARLSVEYGVDMTFMFEHFCGHGFNADLEDGPCYRGPGNENWFDLTCIHPNPTGHGVLADMFFETISE